jgi:hypothetical protein
MRTLDRSFWPSLTRLQPSGTVRFWRLRQVAERPHRGLPAYRREFPDSSYVDSCLLGRSQVARNSAIKPIAAHQSRLRQHTNMETCPKCHAYFCADEAWTNGGVGSSVPVGLQEPDTRVSCPGCGEVFPALAFRYFGIPTAGGSTADASKRQFEDVPVPSVTLRTLLLSTTPVTVCDRAYPRCIGVLMLVFAALLVPAAVVLSARSDVGDFPFVLGVFGSVYLARKGSSIAQRTAREVLADDPRPPLLFLRSFSQDGTDRNTFGVPEQSGPRSSPPFWFLYRLLGWRRAALEPELAKALRNNGPFIAIGRPGESVPEEGASRLYTDDSSWKLAVATAVKESQLILWQGATTSSTLWELSCIARLASPGHVLLIVPNPSVKAQAFEELRYHMNQRLPRPIPSIVEDINFVAFDDNWNAFFLPIMRVAPLLNWFTPSNIDLPSTLKARFAYLR